MGLKKQKLNSQGKAKATKLVSKSKEGERLSDVELEVHSSSDEVSSEGDGSGSDEELENLSSLDEDDDIDVADVSSGESDDDSGLSEDDEDNIDGDEEIMKIKKKKSKLNDGSESFGNAFTAIVGSHLKAYDRKDPIMARSKATSKKLESDKLEAKAKRLLNTEKKELMDKIRVTKLLPSADEPEKARQIIEKEKKLKKIAQRGVDKLFNAVLYTQIKTNQEISKEQVGSSRKAELMNEISKEKFLDLVQAAAHE